MPTQVNYPGGGPTAITPRFAGTARQALADLLPRAGEPRLEELPFSRSDATGGTETELQAVVEGDAAHVDLPLSIRESSYYANIVRRADAGETSRRTITDLEHFVADNPAGVWENSWVRVPLPALSRYARSVLDTDLRADRSDPGSGLRADLGRFFVGTDASLVRLPVSYLLRLALADALERDPQLPQTVRVTGERLLDHFSSDNTSPETFSFYVARAGAGTTLGTELAREKGQRFLLSQLLAAYANRALGLAEHGQRALVYLSPQPPQRQRELNECVSDSFYRELFVSPCLSGWDRGEEKMRYMHLCHQVLSRSQLNTIPKLRECGIIGNNLVVLPNTSNTSLSNNGTHISLGSRRLSAALCGPEQRLASREKFVGDLVTKVVEHFLPLFAGTYSAAPHRLAFADFHPEKVLGFLPHELHSTHLRMIWRRWKKKSALTLCGQPLTPFGPRWLDHALTRLCGLRGDFVPDYRLVDYLVSLMSTDRSPALDGTPASARRLKADLSALGVFDESMALYLLFRQREAAVAGYAGFEARYYSAFYSFRDDLAPAADLQQLVTLAAVHWIARGELDHGDIPDTPFVESERRQIFFGAALGIPTFFVRQQTPNHFLRRILRYTHSTRPSRRYAGFLRVYNEEFRRALLAFLRAEAAETLEHLGATDLLTDLEQRLPPHPGSVATQLVQPVLTATSASHPLELDAADFNRRLEDFYRNGLRHSQTGEALDQLEQDLGRLDSRTRARLGLHDPQLGSVLQEAPQLLARARAHLADGDCDRTSLRGLIRLLLIQIHADSQRHTERDRRAKRRKHG